LRHLSYANVMATIAVFVALGGSSYAALKVTGRDVRDGSLTGRDIKDRSVGARDLARDVIRRGPAGPAGPQGPKGDAGPQGERGATGTVDTSRFYDRATSDARFLRVDGKAADAALLDGTPKSAFVGISDGYVVLPGGAPSATACAEASHHGRLATDGSGGEAWLCTAEGWRTLGLPHMTLEAVPTVGELGIHVTASGFPPNTPVTHAWSSPGGGLSGSGPVGTTDDAGTLDETRLVSACGAGGQVREWRILVGGRLALLARRTYPTC